MILATPSPIDGLSGWRQLRLPSVDSTNAEAIRRISPDSDRLWIVSDTQTAGRGRHGRDWVSPVGNLYCSLLMLDLAPSESLSTLPLVASVALHRSLSSIAGSRSDDLRIKWPNDILLGDKKISGILLESGRHDSTPWVVLGFGVNCAACPPDLPATCLADEGIDTTPDAIFGSLSRELASALDEWDSGANFLPIRDYWLTHCIGIGARMSARTESLTLTGIMDGIDDSGRLTLLGDDGETHYIMSGDVFF